MENDMSEKVGRIYKMVIRYDWAIWPRSIQEGVIVSRAEGNPTELMYERVVKILRLEGDSVIYTTLAVSRNDIIFDFVPHNGYKFHKTYKPFQSATEIPLKDLPLFISWPLTTPDFFRVLNGEI